MAAFNWQIPFVRLPLQSLILVQLTHPKEAERERQTCPLGCGVYYKQTPDLIYRGDADFFYTQFTVNF